MDAIIQAQPVGLEKAWCDEEQSSKMSAKSIPETTREQIGKRSTNCAPVIPTEQISKNSAKCSPQTPRVFECVECGRQFRRSPYLARHMASHRGERRFQCDKCNKKYLYASGLAYHKLTHKGDKNWVCDVCGKKYWDKFSLTRHKISHEKLFRFICHVCGRGFSYKSLFTKHQLIHMREAFNCSVCNKKFQEKHSLEKHILSHAEKERKHGRSVASVFHTHPSQPPSCHIQAEIECMESCTQISENGMHLPLILPSREVSKVKHNESSGDQFSCQATGKELSSPRKEENYECLLCEAKFTSHTTLANHKLAHRKENTFSGSHKETVIWKNHQMRHDCVEGEVIEELVDCSQNSVQKFGFTKSLSFDKIKQNNSEVIIDVPVLSYENSLTQKSHNIDDDAVKKDCYKGMKVNYGYHKRKFSTSKTGSKRQSSGRNNCELNSTAQKQEKSDYEKEVELYCSDLIRQTTSSQKNSCKFYVAVQEQVELDFEKEVELYCSDLLSQTSTSYTGKEVEISQCSSCKSNPSTPASVDRELIEKCHSAVKKYNCDMSRDFSSPEMGEKLENKSQVPHEGGPTTHTSNGTGLKDRCEQTVKICWCLTKQMSAHETAAYQESSEKSSHNCTHFLAERESEGDCSNSVETSFSDVAKQTFHEAEENLVGSKEVLFSSHCTYSDLISDCILEVPDNESIRPASCKVGEKTLIASHNLTTQSVIQTEEKGDYVNSEIPCEYFTRQTPVRNRGNIEEIICLESYNNIPTTPQPIQTGKKGDFDGNIVIPNYCKTRQISKYHEAREKVGIGKLCTQKRRGITYKTVETKLNDYGKEKESLESDQTGLVSSHESTTVKKDNLLTHKHSTNLFSSFHSDLRKDYEKAVEICESHEEQTSAVEHKNIVNSRQPSRNTRISSCLSTPADVKEARGKFEVTHGYYARKAPTVECREKNSSRQFLQKGDCSTWSTVQAELKEEDNHYKKVASAEQNQISACTEKEMLQDSRQASEKTNVTSSMLMCSNVKLGYEASSKEISYKRLYSRNTPTQKGYGILNDDEYQKKLSCKSPLSVFVSSDGEVQLETISKLSSYKLSHTRTPSTKGQKIFKCEVCSKGFTVNRNLKRHLMIHSGEKPYKCSQCGRLFSRNDNFKIHQASCKGGLVSHTSSPVSKNGSLTNQSCHKTLRKSGLGNMPHNSNPRKHTQTEKREHTFGCDGCHKHFSKKSDLVKHINAHTLCTGVKKIECEDADSSEQKRSQTAHQSHKERNFYTCGVCFRQFLMLGNLTKHQLVHKDTESFRMGKRSIYPDKKFECTECHKLYAYKSTLKRHFRNSHGGKSSMTAKICGQQF